jgi:CubicO group peptidase (beta-lactamase class C family)
MNDSTLLTSTRRILAAQVSRAQVEGRAPAMIGGIIRERGLAWSAGAGDVQDPHQDVQFRIGSITKTVTAIAVLRLRDEGLLDLSDELDQHLPGTPLGRRTISQLLSHLGGVRSESPGQWWERVPGGTLDELGLSDTDAVLPPGRRFHYSNVGFGLLGELAARRRGRSWIDVVTDEILTPLGMTRTTPRPDGAAAQGFAVHPWADVLQPEPEHDAVVMAPAGQLWSTAADLARLGAFLLGDTGGVLSTDTVDEMVTPISGTDGEAGWSSYGLGVQVQRLDGVTLAGHGGSMPGFLAGLWVDRAEQAGALSLANTTSGPDNQLAFRLLAALRAAEPRILDPWTPQPPPVDLDLLGPWYWGPAPHALRAIPGGLLELEGLGRRGRPSRFAPAPDGTWVGLDGYYAGETLRLSQNSLNVATFIFTRTPYDPGAPVPGGVDDAGWR